MAGKRLTTQEFLKRVNEKWNNEYEAVTEYCGSREPITLRHLLCGNEVTKSRAGNFLENSCPFCVNEKISQTKQSKTPEEVAAANAKRATTWASRGTSNSEYLKQRWANLSQENKELHCEKTKQGMAAMPGSQKKEVAAKRANTIAAKSDAEKAATREKRQAAWQAKSEEEKKAWSDLGKERWAAMSTEQKGEFSTKLKRRHGRADENILPTISKENLQDFLKGMEAELGRKPTGEEVSLRLGYKSSGYIYRILNKYELFDKYIQHKGPSTQEYDIRDYIVSLSPGIKIEMPNRTILGNGQHIDLFFPDLNKGIEFCGIYWHSSSAAAARGNPKPENYHQNKMRLAAQQGIHLIQIFEDEWMTRRELVLSKIAVFLGLCSREKIYARKCSVKPITDNKIIKEFVDRNHIQGYSPASIKLGLYSGDELVAAMTFKKSNKGLKENLEGVYELDRYCTDINKQVLGGAGKLLSYFLKNAPSGAKEVTTFADLRWSFPESNMYTQLGFEEISRTKPSYFYVNLKTMERFHRANFKKSDIAKKFPDIYQEELTEKEMMKLAGFFRIHDAGNIKYRMNIQ